MRKIQAGEADSASGRRKAKSGNQGLKVTIDFCRILLCGLLLAVLVPRYQFGAQAPVSKVEAFPERLLEGTARFDLALSLQGDVRGNYGPCG